MKKITDVIGVWLRQSYKKCKDLFAEKLVTVVLDIFKKLTVIFRKATASRKTGYNPAILLILAILTSFSVLALRTSYLNKKMNSQLMYYTSLTCRQDDVIQTFVSNDDITNQKINEFNNKYHEIADTYVMNRINNDIANRGNNVDRSFATEIGELRSILNELVSIDAISDDTVNRFTETEDNIRNYINSMPDVWPMQGRITSYFGNRYVPYRYEYIEHSGLDIAGLYGQAITAAASGYVVLSSYYGGYGNTIVIDHGNGINTLYAHASSLCVQSGTYVNKGDTIAACGSTGNSDGNHLHFEIRVNGVTVDPLNYLCY